MKMNIESVDKTIEAICGLIQDELKETGHMNRSVLLEVTKALAELVSARVNTKIEVDSEIVGRTIYEAIRDNVSTAQ